MINSCCISTEYNKFELKCFSDRLTGYSENNWSGSDYGKVLDDM